jgi:hypothetical protein
VLDRSGWRLLVIRDIARSPFKPPALVVLGRLFHDPHCGLVLDLGDVDFSVVGVEHSPRELVVF